MIPLVIVVFIHACVAQITVAAAADMQFALEEVKNEFTKETGAPVKTIFGSTGKLTSQIMNGAPFDVFIAASMAEPESLYAKGFAATRPKPVTIGLLVLWSVKDTDISNGMEALRQSGVVKIALPDPAHAPYGRAAVAAMKAAGLYDELLPKVVYGDNITQTAQYIGSGSVDAGFNAKSIVESPQMKGKGKWVEIDRKLYPAIMQGAMILRYGDDNNPVASKQFYDYIFSDKSREIFVRYGFLLP
jgi:molybdate transport system substrate-binding protein